MAIHFKCKTCGKAYRVDERMAGKPYTCRACGAHHHVPQPDQPEPPEIVAEPDDEEEADAITPSDEGFALKLENGDAHPRQAPTPSGRPSEQTSAASPRAEKPPPAEITPFDAEPTPAAPAEMGSSDDTEGFQLVGDSTARMRKPDAAAPEPPGAAEAESDWDDSILERPSTPGRPAQPGPGAPATPTPSDDDESAFVLTQAAPHHHAAADPTAGPVSEKAAAMHAPTTQDNVPPPAAHRARSGPRIALPVGKTIGLVLTLGVLGALWFLVVRPMQAHSRYETALAPARKGRYKTAADQLSAIRDGLPADYRELADLRIAQLQAEADLETYAGTYHSGEVDVQFLPLAEGEATSNALQMRAVVTNGSPDPVPLRAACFYMRCTGAFEPAVGMRTEPEGVTAAHVPPGATGSAIVNFLQLPGTTFGVPADPMTPRFVVYCDGTNYVADYIDLGGLLPDADISGSGQIPVP